MPTWNWSFWEWFPAFMKLMCRIWGPSWGRFTEEIDRPHHFRRFCFSINLFRQVDILGIVLTLILRFRESVRSGDYFSAVAYIHSYFDHTITMQLSSSETMYDWRSYYHWSRTGILISLRYFIWRSYTSSFITTQMRLGFHRVTWFWLILGYSWIH